MSRGEDPEGSRISYFISGDFFRVDRATGVVSFYSNSKKMQINQMFYSLSDFFQLEQMFHLNYFIENLLQI